MFLWILFGGFYMALGWLIAAVIMVLTIIDIPWARAAFTIAAYTLLPFGHTVESHAGQAPVAASLALSAI